ncbi:hypothetical protein M2175_000014 [Bradyrhizobium elkanii]|uniref:Uncharacterized protein n=1 Tax=Bradyrhizobium japonicum TaxID=375 RepID=A0A1L3F0U2_BRAJP|nr:MULTISPECIES: hypothetical protein [Bradyrhizobium]APG06931.1 hypothetical protein BKD09_01195 [Bradyrhizobium japonicum]MCS3924983.1 hypothetical protein [Bradyrhizobium elkanii]MCS3974612.1 hypothetical protein [Bradyrhizobium japonicum]
MRLLCLTISAGTAFAADDEDDAPAKPDVPNIYLDLRTIYATIPAGTLGLGFGNTTLSAAFEALAVRRGTTLPSGLPAASASA